MEDQDGQNNQLRFRHSGKLGDIIYSLPTVRALGGGAIFVRAGGEIDDATAATIIPLLQEQPYISRAAIWRDESYDVDLDAFRLNNPLQKNLADAHLGAFGLQASFRDSAWLTVKPCQLTTSPKVVFARSTLRPGATSMWEFLYRLVGESAVFIGTEEEHADFVRRVGPVQRIPVKNLLEMSRLIDSCALFVGNQSCPYAIAEGLKKPSILEVDLSQPNCIFRRPNALQIAEQKDMYLLEPFIQSIALLRREEPATYSLHANASDKPSYDYYGNANLRILERIPRSARRILDVGCGSGHLGEALKREDPRREVWGIEEVSHVAAEAKGRLDHLLAGNAERMDPFPLPIAYFDSVIFGDVLEHMRDPGAVLSRLSRHLAPNGTLLCSVPNIAHWSVIRQLLHGEFTYEDAGLLDRTHLKFFTPKSFKRLLWSSGYMTTAEWPLEVGGDVTALFVETGAQLGLNPAASEKLLSTYQTVFQAEPLPTAIDEERRALLYGPHRGQLGHATKRCSVIVLTYNSESSIFECLDSVVRNLGQDDELLVVDNASTDATCSIVHNVIGPLENCRLIVNETNVGFSAGCNIGILASTGEHVILLNPDTKVWSQWIDGMLGMFFNSEVGAVGPVSDRVSGDQFLRYYVPAEFNAPTLDELAALLCKCNNYAVDTKLLIGFCIAFPRRVLNEVGLLIKEMFLGSDDLEISWRLRMLGYKLLIATNVLVHHKTGVSQESVAIETRRVLSSSSATILQRKLRMFYGQNTWLDSISIWGNRIFDHALWVEEKS